LAGTVLNVGMLKITAIETESGDKVLQLSGTISGAWVQELQECCEAWIAAGNNLTLDLTDVQYADCAGVELLSRLKLRTVRVFPSTPLLSRLLDAHEALNVEGKPLCLLEGRTSIRCRCRLFCR
jgi:ABC-type transporter Mla MlaB component